MFTHCAVVRYQRFYRLLSSLQSISCKPAQPVGVRFPLKLANQFNNVLLTQDRAYAKKAALTGKKSKHKVKVQDADLEQVIDVENLRCSLQRFQDRMKEEYIKNLSLRSSGGAIETMKFDFEGSTYELQEVAQIGRKGQQTITLDLSGFPQVSKMVMDTLIASSLNLNPQQEGTTIYVPLPKVTREHREILAKRARQLFIECKDSSKQVQEKYIRELKDGELGEDELYRVVDQIRALTEEYISESEKVFKSKEEELLMKNKRTEK